MPPGRTTMSPAAAGRAARRLTGRPAATQAAKPPSSTATRSAGARPTAESTTPGPRPRRRRRRRPRPAEPARTPARRSTRLQPRDRAAGAGRPAPGGRELGVEVDEHGARDVCRVVVGAAGRAAEPPPHVEHDGAARPASAASEPSADHQRRMPDVAVTSTILPALVRGSRARRYPDRTGVLTKGLPRERPDRHHRDVPPHHPRAGRGGCAAAARPDRRAARAERPDREPDRGPDGARRAAGRRGRPAPGAHRPGPGPRRRRDAQAPPGRAAARST